MKKFIKNIFLSYMLFIAILLIGCSKKATTNTENISEPTINAEYYKKLGYHTIDYDENIEIICDETTKVTIKDFQIMVPNNSEITVNFNSNNSEFEYNNGNYISYSKGEVLTNFVINSELFDLNNCSIKIKKDTNISAKFKNFKTIGIAVYAVIDESDEEYQLFKNNEFTSSEVLEYKNNELTSTLMNLLCVYSNDASSIEDFAENKMLFSTTFKSTTENLEDNKFKLNISIEVFIETTKILPYTILKDENNNIYLYKLNENTDYLTTKTTIENISNTNSNLDCIEITFSHDLSFSDEYERI